MLRDLNVAGSFANTQIRRALNVGGQTDVDVANSLQLSMNLDPMRLLPYGDWRVATGGISETSVAAQAYNLYLVNPVASATVAVVERFLISGSLTIEVVWSRSNLAATGGLAQFNGMVTHGKDGQFDNNSCPLYMFRNTAPAGPLGAVCGGEKAPANQSTRALMSEIPLYPGDVFGCQIVTTAATLIAPLIKIYFQSPVPV